MDIMSRIYATNWGKTALGAVVGAGALLAAVGPAHAASLTTAQIGAITMLLQSFNVEAGTIANVQSVLGGQVVASTTSATAIEAGQIGFLRFGQKGRAVCYLQSILASDPDVALSVAIDEANDDCSFGPMTERALKKFQLKHGLEGVGFVGPKTLAALRATLMDRPLAVEEDEEGDNRGQGKKRICAFVPPGRLIVPGWRKKNDGRPVVSECQKLPWGIINKIGGVGTSTASSTAALNLSNVSAKAISDSSAKIVWMTNKPATSKVYYATSTPISVATAGTESQSGTRTSHELDLAGLESDTSYYLMAVSSDASGNTATSSTVTFTTGD